MLMLVRAGMTIHNSRNPTMGWARLNRLDKRHFEQNWFVNDPRAWVGDETKQSERRAGVHEFNEA